MNKGGLVMESAKLMEQKEARRLAASLNVDREPGFPVAVAQRVPATAWGGAELGWTVVYQAVAS